MAGLPKYAYSTIYENTCGNFTNKQKKEEEQRAENMTEPGGENIEFWGSWIANWRPLSVTSTYMNISQRSTQQISNDY